MVVKSFFLFFLLNISFVCFSQGVNNNGKKYVSNSVLSDNQSQWYKIAINKDGFFKLTYNDLLGYGIDPVKISPTSIHIYGNATGILPEQNNYNFVDDLVQNTVMYYGMEDGVFDSQDYIVFYGFGPNRFDLVNGFFQRALNIYSDYSYYFIRVSDNIPIKSVSNYNTSKSANITSNAYDYYTIHELEDTSLVNGGQRWYGELFDNVLNYSLSFDLPSTPQSLVSIKYSFASNASQSGNFFSVISNNNILSKTYLSTVSSDYSRNESSFSFTSLTEHLSFNLQLSRLDPTVKLFFDKFEINTRCLNQFQGVQYRFRDLLSVKNNGVTTFSVATSSPIQVWDVTNRSSPMNIVLLANSSGYEFVVETDSLREFAVSANNEFFSPIFVSKIPIQNIHGSEGVSLLIVTPDEFIEPANKLANIHLQMGESVRVFTLNQIYNEFSSGSVDPTAIKLCAKMFYDKYGSNSDKSLKNLLLFGDGTFDPKNRVANNNYWVPTYEFLNSEDPLNAMVSDDYFGILSTNGSINGNDSMQIGVGRMLISSVQMANDQISKIEQYLRKGYISDSIDCCGKITESSFGDWRTNFVQIADDEENGYFVNSDAEPQSQLVQNFHPEMNNDKIYCDAYKQVTTAGGERYPDVNTAIDQVVATGSLIVNYVGHGGEVGAAAERIITIPQINSWNNFSKLCLFVSSTCEFTKYDDPSRISAGEWMSLNPHGGAIALMTTTRPVFFSVNTSTGISFFKNVFERDANKLPLSFGEILRRTKNMVNSDINKHSFTLIGDPALRIAVPIYAVKLDSVNGKDVKIQLDTIKALSKGRLSGHIEDQFGNKINVNGILNVRVFDKAKSLKTLGQDPTSPIISFQNQENILFKGRSKVMNGNFTVNFITPKDIDYSFGAGKVSLYYNDSLKDGIGSENRIVIGGVDNSVKTDTIGPKITMYLNDNNFVSSGITNQTPKLVVQLEDESGINTIGNGIGHDAVAVLDGNVSNPIILNNFYVSNINSYQSGRIVYDFTGISEGRHNLKVKVWDVFNNPSESTLDFVVQKDTKLEISHVLNYPNPFSTNTHFYFEHNQVCNLLEVQIQILTISGRLVKTIHENVSLQGFRSEGIAWDGRDDFGDKLAKGVYLYRISVKNNLGEITEKIEKLAIL